MDPMTTEPRAWRHGPRVLERRLLAIVFSVMFHMTLLAAGALASAYVVAAGGLPVAVLPRQPLLVLTVALVMAHCSLGALWWARSAWSPHFKTIVAVLCCGGMWLLLIALLETTRRSGVAAAAWAACLATQVVLTGLGAILVELAIHYQAAAARTRFSLLFLLVWMSVFAAVLGAAGALAARAGFQLAAVADWEYFQQLQGVGLAGAALATGLYASIRVPPRWNIRGLACVATLVGITAAATAALGAIFGDRVGADFIDMIWLFGGQGMFLIATLGPLELAREPDET
jgi:hypothetical protein